MAQPHALRLSLAEGFLERQSLVGPIERRLPCLFGHTEADGRDADRASDIENGQGILETSTDLTDDISRRDPDIGEGHVRILDTPATLKLTSLSYADTLAFHIKDEGGMDLVLCALAFRNRDPHWLPVGREPLRRDSCDQRDIAGDGIRCQASMQFSSTAT